MTPPRSAGHHAIAALADKEYQRRTWTNAAGDLVTDPSIDLVTGSFAACLPALADDGHVLRDPASAIGMVLLPRDDVHRLRALANARRPICDAQRIYHRHRPGCRRQRALHCLPPVIASAWIGPDADDPESTG